MKPTDEHAMMQRPYRDLPGRWLLTAWVPPAGRLTLKDWGAMVEKVATVHDALHWWVGDLINYGEHAYGEKYSQWLDLFSYATVSRDAWVCREIPREIRKPPHLVPFSTHVILAPSHFSVEEKAWWLDLCAAEGWSGARLKSEIEQNALLSAGEHDALPVGEHEDFICISKFSDNGRDGPGADGLASGEPGGSDFAAGARSIPCPHCGGLVPLPLPLFSGEVIR